MNNAILGIIICIVLYLLLIYSMYFLNKPEKQYTNQQIVSLGQLLRVDGSCEHTVTYLYEYKRKKYLITFVGDLRILDPDKEAFTV